MLMLEHFIAEFTYIRIAAKAKRNLFFFPRNLSA
jgi:hypothetical protein